MQLSKYQASDFGKVAILMGGQSEERNISLESGHAVHKALRAAGVDAYAIDCNQNSFSLLISEHFDRVFIALHGRGGEDGTIQGALETLGIPYSGSHVLGSALAMDKIRSKAIWRSAGLPTPASVELNAASNWKQIVEELGLPIMVKPVREGSSIGAIKVSEADRLSSAWVQSKQFDDRVMAERWITGAEYTVPVLHNRVLPAIRLETKRQFYDYSAKYEDEDTRYVCPCGLDTAFEKKLGQLALQACETLAVSGWGRVDILIDENKKAWLIEVNTVPGMTSHSLVPLSAKQVGISFEELVIQILATSFCCKTPAGMKSE